MKLKVSRRIWLAQILIGNAIVLGLFVTHGVRAGNEPMHLSTDWSHRHLVFSPPKNLMQQFQLSGDVRYFQQWVRRNVVRKEQESDEREERDRDSDGDGKGHHRHPPPGQLERDWSVYLGSGGTVGAGNFPAKFSFNATVASCGSSATPDFVVYNTSLAPSAAGTPASRNQTFTANTATNGQTFTITNNNIPAPNTLTLYANTGGSATASGTITVTSQPAVNDTVTVGSVTYTFATTVGSGSEDVLLGSNTSETAQNLQAAINDILGACFTASCFSSGGIGAPNPAVAHPATRAGNVITLTAAIAGFSGNFALMQTGGHITIGGGGGTGGGGSNTGLDFLVGASAAATATNLAAAIARNGATVGVTSTSAAAVVTVTSTNTGSGATGGNVDISLVGTVTGLTILTPLTGGAAGASIVAYDNIYTGCTGTVPSVFWAYNTGGTVVTSPVLSLDGKQVAFVQNVGTTGTLVLLKWKPNDGTVDAPSVTLTTLTAAQNASYPGCTAPCMISFPFPAGGIITDNNSSPFYDYSNDIIYVGDDGGTLRRFNSVFKGTPAPQSTLGFPVAVTGGGVLTSPVFEKVSGKVFVGSSTGILTAVLASAGTETQSSAVGGANGINDSPIVDTTNGNVYVIVSNTTATPTVNKSGIYRFTVGFVSGSTGAQTVVSAGSNFTSIYEGNFDNAFYSGGAGHMYVCGPAAGGGHPTLYQIVVSAVGALSTVNTGPELSNGASALCSGVTEVFNPNAAGGAKDFIFLSVRDSGLTSALINCPLHAGCLMLFDVTSGAAISTLTGTSATISAPGGASGVVVDNTVGSATLVGASQVYCTPLADETCITSGAGVIGGCAVQASQAALQ